MWRTFLQARRHSTLTFPAKTIKRHVSIIQTAPLSACAHSNITKVYVESTPKKKNSHGAAISGQCDVNYGCGTHHVMNEPRPSARISYCKRRTRRAWERGYCDGTLAGCQNCKWSLGILLHYLQSKYSCRLSQSLNLCSNGLPPTHDSYFALGIQLPPAPHSPFSVQLGLEKKRRRNSNIVDCTMKFSLSLLDRVLGEEIFHSNTQVCALPV